MTQNLRAPAAANYLGLSPSTLAKMRVRGDGPAYSKVGPRIVVYDVAVLDSYLRARRRTSTSTTVETESLGDQGADDSDSPDDDLDDPIDS